MTDSLRKSNSTYIARGAMVLSLTLALVAVAAAFSVRTHGVAWLAWIMLTPLLLAVRSLKPRYAMLAGAFWGTCLFGFASFGGDPLFAPSAGAFLRLAVVSALYAGAGSYVTRRKGYSPLFLGLGWIAVELSLLPLGLTNGLLARMLDQTLVMRTLGYFAGYLVVAFFIVYVNASILSFAVAAVSVPGGSRKPPRSANAVIEWSIPESPTLAFEFLGNRHARAPPAC